MRIDKLIIGDKKMKIVVVGQTKYYIQSRDDMISLAHQLAREGKSIAEIAQILGISVKTVKRYLSDCW